MHDAANEANPKRIVTITYKNHRDETRERHIIPIAIFYGQTEWHPKDQWMLNAWDIDKSAERTFAIGDIANWTPIV